MLNISTLHTIYLFVMLKFKNLKYMYTASQLSDLHDSKNFTITCTVF